MKSLKTFKATMRLHFKTTWDTRCQDVLDRTVLIVPENADPEADTDLYVELWFVMPSGSRQRANGGAYDPEHRTLGRLQLTIYIKRGLGTEIIDDLYEIWEPMWSTPGLFEGVFFEPASPVQQVQEGEVWTQYVTDVPFRWDDI